MLIFSTRLLEACSAISGASDVREISLVRLGKLVIEYANLGIYISTEVFLIPGKGRTLGYLVTLAKVRPGQCQ